MDQLPSKSLTTSLFSRHWQPHYRSAFAIGLISLLVGCQATSCTSYDNNSAPLPSRATLIDDASNLYQVDGSLFRSEQLSAADTPLLIDNDIDAIINLRFFGRNDNDELLNDIVSHASVDLYNQPLKSWYVTPQEVAQILTQIKALQAQNKRVLVHCYHGADRTGLIVAMYRIIEHDWSIEEAKREMTAGGFGYHPIWINLEKMLNPTTVAAVRAQL